MNAKLSPKHKRIKSMSDFTPKRNVPQFDRKQLINLKTRALRSGAWFRTLKRIDRVLIDLTIKVVDNIRSSSLAKSILMLTDKLEQVMKSPFSRRIEKLGSSLAQKVSLAGQKIGHPSAVRWASDSSFAFFLAVMHINSNPERRT
jgi:hypothetical protein